MRKVAQTSVGKAVLFVLAVTLFVGQLSGCAIVGPVLSIGGLAGIGPLSYISTAYTVGEFSYEYAANDATPDEVIEHKIDAVLSGEAFELPDYMLSTPDGVETPTSSTMVAEKDVDSETLSFSDEVRQKRIAAILGNRDQQFERLEFRRMAFLDAKQNDRLSLRVSSNTELDLYQGAVDEVSLD
ncbi:hypothetical protein [Pseudodesulfovibrio sediminis]|uniref:Lipoprotein n=1 Tax=Pseudodesulfovibrio sediminis TaxID=2810563 RepID=A0ABM7P541_9BACT|nr:hypothetical protein [Pseudodesulfovibrio sediminis]BCS88747.1 hypothetical protein PSDVSF_19890 [Pseudodesulfovibrio sediminis]